MGIGDVKRHIQEKTSKGMEMQKKSFYIHFHVTFIFDESQAFFGCSNIFSIEVVNFLFNVHSLKLPFSNTTDLLTSC